MVEDGNRPLKSRRDPAKGLDSVVGAAKRLRRHNCEILGAGAHGLLPEAGKHLAELGGWTLTDLASVSNQRAELQ
jgi:hypothetical protein